MHACTHSYIEATSSFGGKFPWYGWYAQPVRPWELQLFGGLKLVRDAQVVTRFRTRATDSVFAYLALHLGQRIRRDTLIEIGWPNSDPARGRQSLRMALSSIRAVLGPDCLVTDGEVAFL